MRTEYLVRTEYLERTEYLVRTEYQLRTEYLERTEHQGRTEYLVMHLVGTEYLGIKKDLRELGSKARGDVIRGQPSAHHKVLVSGLDGDSQHLQQSVTGRRDLEC